MSGLMSSIRISSIDDVQSMYIASIVVALVAEIGLFVKSSILSDDRLKINVVSESTPMLPMAFATISNNEFYSKSRHFKSSNRKDSIQVAKTDLIDLQQGWPHHLNPSCCLQ